MYQRQPDRLPRGCISGHYVCEEETRSWNLVNAAYASGNWEAYQTALVAYRAHRPKMETSHAHTPR
jgi:hypothetical protein